MTSAHARVSSAERTAATRSPSGPTAARFPVAAEHSDTERSAQSATAETGPVRVPWSFADVASHPREGAGSVAIPDGGMPLPHEARTDLEQRFGEDFADVQIHSGAAAADAARSVGAAAFSVGSDIVLGSGVQDAASPRSRRIVAHELAHVVQARRVPALSGLAHRQSEKSAQAKADDLGLIADEAARYLESASSYYRAMGATGRLDRAIAGRAEAAQAPPAKAAKGSGDKAKPGAAAAPTQGRPPAPGLTADGLAKALEKLESVYENARTTLEKNLPDDTARAARLRKAYVAAASGARAAAVDQTRVNLNIISAPKAAKGDHFIKNATTYAGIYYGKGRNGEQVRLITGVGSVADLFTEIQNAAPERLIGRVDIFAHGTIEPVHELKLGTKWHRVGDFQQEAEKRSGDAKTLATQSRFDGSTVIELHACRLGADDGDPGKTNESITHGRDFAKSFGTALGGEQGQQVVAYKQKWVPRLFQLSLGDPRKLTGRARDAFEKEAIAVWDAAMAGGTEAQALMSEAERATGKVTRDRKVAIMEKLMVDSGGRGWLIGHQYPTGDPASSDAKKDVKGKRDTFSNEADWRSLVLQVKVPEPAAVTP